MFSKQQQSDFATFKWLLANPGKTMVLVSPSLTDAEATVERIKRLLRETAGRTVDVERCVLDGKPTKDMRLTLEPE